MRKVLKIAEVFVTTMCLCTTMVLNHTMQEEGSVECCEFKYVIG